MNKKMALVLSALMATNTLGVYPTSIMASEANQGVVDVVTSEDLEEKVLETEEVVQTTTASAIVIQNLPTKTEYKLGEDLDLTGGAIAVTHEDDTTKVVALTDTLVNVSGYNKEQVGVQNLEVKYEELSTNFVVEVVEEPKVLVEPILSKDKWTECEDGKWRKITEQPGLDFESMPLGEYIGEKIPDKFYDGNTAGNFEIIEIETDNYGLMFTPSRSGPNNIQYKSNVNDEYSYELKFKYNVKGNFNTEVKSIRNGSDISGKSLDSEGVVINPKNPIYPSVGEGNFTGMLVIDKPTGGNIELKLWKAGNAQILIDKMEMVAVSPKNPDKEEVSEKKQLIRDNDILTQKGTFEEWNEEKIPDFDKATAGFSKQGTVDVVDEHKYVGTHSAKITTGSQLIIQANELSPNTEYSMFFVAEPNGGNVEFRMSGFKDNDRYEYDNGDYNGGNWQNSELGKSNMLNWVENLKINKKGWNTFRYDFTTGNNTQNSVRASLKAVGADAYVDEIYLVEKSKIEQVSHPLPTNDQLSKGHRILIDEGMQFQSWISSSEGGWVKTPTLEMIQDMGLTAAQYNDGTNFNASLHKVADEKGVSLKWATAFGPKGSHISNEYQDSGNSPTEEEWKDGFLTENNGINYLDDLISMCIGDEENYSDTLTQNLKSWFEVIREHYPNVMVHHNEVGNSVQDNLRQISTFNKDMLRKYVRTAKPDLITYDMYYFRERRVGQTVGGTVIPFYDDLNRYRIVASEGYDGTGEQPIPFGQYHYSWRTGPGAATALKRGDGWYEMTESQINLYAFATWAFGGKWMSNFRWMHDNPQYLFTDYRPNEDGVYEQYYIYDQFKEMIRQSLNLGPHLTRLQVQKDVAIIPGEHLTKEGEKVSNNKPNDNVYWDTIKDNKTNKDVFISGIQVDNLGDQNNGLNGDIFISYFNSLNGLTEKDKEVFTSKNPRYFMLLNGLTSGDGLPTEMQQGSAYETRQEVKVQFELPDSSYATKLRKVSRVDGGDTEEEKGKVVSVPLEHILGNTYEMSIVIGGGYADLFYWELGEKNEDTITKEANEQGKEGLVEGQKKYINEIEKRDLEGRTITIGHITGTNDVAPEANMAKNINTPAEKDLYDGNVINLETYATSGGNIGAIGMRYFPQDIWEFRIDRIQKDNDVKLELKEYDWTQEELINNIEQVKAGQEVDGMPDIIVVPDNWLWDVEGLLTHQAVLPTQDFAVIDLEERKWNDAYTEMTTKDGKTYGAFIDPSTNPTGIFVNKTLLGNVGASSLGEQGIYELQKQGKWTFEELEKIIDNAINNDINSKGVKLFADNEQLIRQILVSAGVNTNPYEFDADTPEYKEAMELYSKLKNSDLLLEGTLEEHMKAFSEKKLMFMVAPYEDVAQHLSGAYWYYEDNTIRKYTDNFLGKWGEQTYTQPKDGEPWSVKVKQRPAGKYEMKITDWNFMLFPKATQEDEYRAILNNVSYPVMLASADKPEDVAFIWNQVAEEYKGIDITAMSRGGVERPDGRTWEPSSGDNARDYHALKTVELRAGHGDNLKASGVWDTVLYDLIQTTPHDYEAINKAVADYVGETDTEVPQEVDKAKLSELIEVAKTKKETQYTVQSWKVFSEALKHAEAINTNEITTQGEVNKALNQLKQAMESLVLVSDSSGGSGNKPSKPDEIKKEEVVNPKEKLLEHLPAGDATVLEDIDSHWAKEAITQVVSIGIMVGDGESFRPNDSLTRAEMATMLQRIINSKSTKSDKEIKDVIANEWYADAMYNMNTLGIMTGYADGTFAPKANISRQEMMVIVARLARYYGVDTKVVNQEEVLSSYTDQTDIATWAKEDIAWCVAQGIITGNDNALEVQREVTRAEIATILARMINK